MWQKWRSSIRKFSQIWLYKEDTTVRKNLSILLYSWLPIGNLIAKKMVILFNYSSNFGNSKNHLKSHFFTFSISTFANQ
jgi:hypothetical protein